MNSIYIKIDCDSIEEAESIKNRIPMILSFTKGFLKGSNYNITDDNIKTIIESNVLIVSIELKDKDNKNE